MVMLLAGLQKLSLIDYPDKTSCIVFTAGCNFQCPFCHNPSTQKKMASMREEEFFYFLEKRKGLLDAVCVSGGEPTIHEDLTFFLARIKNMGFLVKLDTNGTNPGLLKELIENNMIDYVAMDVKAPLEKYSLLAGINADDELKEKIKQSIEIIKTSGIAHEFRTTVAPGLIEEGDVKKIAEMIRGSLFYLQQFKNAPEHVSDEFKNKKPYPIEKIDRLCQETDGIVDCRVRNI